MSRFTTRFAGTIPVVLAAAAALSAPARAEDAKDAKKEDLVKKQYVDVKIAEPPKQKGLEIDIKNGATFSLSDSRSVLGQPDGLTFNFGVKFEGTATYRNGGHEWRTMLGYAGTLTKTPAIDAIVKSADQLQFETTYLYFVRKWWGPFARFTLTTPAFKSFDVRPAPVQYAITDVNGQTTTDAPENARTHLDLTTPFKPLTLKETVGPFARPIENKKFSLETRIGLGGLQTFADNQLLLKDDAATPVIEVQELRTVLQLGGEGALDIWGDLYGDKITYKGSISALVPFANNDLVPPGETKKSAFELTNIDMGASITIKLVEWASLDYTVRALRQPQLTDEWQVRHGMLLTFGLGYERKPPKPPGAEKEAKPAENADAPKADAPKADAPKADAPKEAAPPVKQ